MDSPQPQTAALLPGSSAATTSSASSEIAPFASGSGTHMAQGARVCRIGTMDAGAASVTRPTPLLSAAWAQIAAAPAMPRLPATISRWPLVPLWAFRRFSGRAARASPVSISRGRSSGKKAAGMPMSATSISPHTSSPSARKWPVLANWKATVASAQTQGEKAAPVRPFSPEGMSAAITRLPAARSAFMRSISAAATPSGARDSPVP